MRTTDPAVLVGIGCQEANPHSRETYVPCGLPATTIVWHEKDKRAYPMCTACAYHNTNNRGGRLLMRTTSRYKLLSKAVTNFQKRRAR